MPDDKPKWPSRQTDFEAIVLKALWLIIRLMIFSRRAAGGPGSGSDFNALSLRGDILMYMDQHGRPGDEPQKHRREVAYPEL